MPEILSRCRIEASPQAVLDACRSVDLHLNFAAGISARAVAGRVTGLSELGDWTTWSARFFRMRFRLTTQITHYKAPFEMDDSLLRGPFRSFSHCYRIRHLESDANLVELSDHFQFECPLGKAGALFAKRVILPAMERAQRERITGIENVFSKLNFQ